MQLLAVYLSLLAVPVALVAAHDGHDALQMPLGYVKYPYQAVYPGDDEGMRFTRSVRPPLIIHPQLPRTPSFLESPRLLNSHGYSALAKTRTLPLT